MSNDAIQIRIRGVAELDKKLGAFSSGLQLVVEDASRKAVTYVWSEIPDYPAQPLGSTYQRTLTLGRTISAWAGVMRDALSRIEPAFGMVKAFLGTALNYAHWVIDEDDQAWMHKGRWWTLQGVVRGARDGIVQVYATALRDYVRRIFP